MAKKESSQNHSNKGILWFIFLLYILFVVSLLVFKWLPIPGYFPFPPNIKPVNIGFDTSINLIPFQSITLFRKAYGSQLPDDTILSNLLGNILILLPFGFMGSLLSRRFRPWLILLSGLSLILSIELAQLLSGLGVWDIDDILLNSLGLVLGLLLAIPFRFLLYREKQSR